MQHVFSTNKLHVPYLGISSLRFVRRRWFALAFSGGLLRDCVERSWCSSVEACRDGRGGRIAVWWSSSWATMLCCSFRVYQPSGMDEGFYITLQHCSCVKGRGMCDIDIDRHGGFRNDDGRYLHPRTCSPASPDKSSWKLTCNSPRIWCKGKQVAERQDPLVILGRSLWFRHCKLSVPANWFWPGVGAKSHLSNTGNAGERCLRALDVPREMQCDG